MVDNASRSGSPRPSTGCWPSLVRHRGQILSPVKLLELAWSDPFGVGPDRVKYSVMRLRRKLGADSSGARCADRGGPRLRLPLPGRLTGPRGIREPATGPHRDGNRITTGGQAH